MLDNNEYSSAIKHIDNSWSIYANNNERNTGYLVTRVWRVNQETKNSFVFTLFFHHFQVFIICISILSTYLIYFHRFKKEQDSNFFDNWSMIYFTIKPQKEGRFRSGESFNYWSDTIYFYYYIIIIFNFIVRRKKIWIIRIIVR